MTRRLFSPTLTGYGYLVFVVSMALTYKLFLVCFGIPSLWFIYAVAVVPLMLFMPRLIPFLILVVIFSLYMDTLNVSMLQLDSQKFYQEAFGGGYGDSILYSTVNSTGFIYRMYAMLIGTKSPQLLVSINLFLHIGACLFAYGTIRMLFVNRNIKLNSYYMTPLLVSPLLVTYLPFLMKDLFVVFALSGSIFAFVRWRYTDNFRWLLLTFIFIFLATLFRLYSLLYLIAFWMIVGKSLRMNALIALSAVFFLVLFFGKKSIVFIIFSYAAIFLIPNFFNPSNWLTQPLLCVEGVVYLCLFMGLFMFFVRRGWWFELLLVAFSLLFVASIYAFTSLYRIEMTSYVAEGGYLTDNFLRKKLPIVYLLYFGVLYWFGRLRHHASID